MAKIMRLVSEQKGAERFGFFCPGCGFAHWFQTKGEGSCWTWNEDFEKPTVKPSILMDMRGEDPKRCHSFVTDGKIRFLGDCSHNLKGRTVEIPDWDEIGNA